MMGSKQSFSDLSMIEWYFEVCLYSLYNSVTRG